MTSERHLSPVAAGIPERCAEAGSRDLVRRAKRGDKRAFESLYRAHAGRVHALCLRLTGDRAMAEEMTQEAFVRAWMKLPGFREEAQFSSWMHRVAVNVVVEAQRAAFRRVARVVPVADPDNLAADRAPAGPEGPIDLERAIAALPPGARTVFVLHDVEGHNHEEIAGMTGMAPGTSKAQLHWARKRLREWLTRWNATRSLDC